LKVRVAVVQTLTVRESEGRTNTARAFEYIDEAAERGAQVVCFPESYPGPWQAPIKYSPFQELSKKAKEKEVYVIAGSAEDAGDKRVHATLLFIGPKGELVGTYRRTTPAGPWIYANEPPWSYNYKEANDIPIFETEFGKVGLLMCSEVYVPELSRILAIRGAEIVFMPAGTPKGRLWHTWKNLIWSRAIENLMYTATCQNIFDPQKEDGLAMVAGPEEIVLESKQPGIFVAELDLDRIQWLRETSDGFPDQGWRTKPGVLKEWRRPELYRKVLGQHW
jgi:predicted amidohydrolase